MKNYNIIVQDIYEHDKQKHVSVDATNPYEAHKKGLKHTSALREEIAIIRDTSNKIVFTFRDGFSQINE
jgi:hypothetical protein